MKTTPEQLLHALEQGHIEWLSLSETEKQAVHDLCMKMERQKQGYGGGNN